MAAGTKVCTKCCDRIKAIVAGTGPVNAAFVAAFGAGASLRVYQGPKRFDATEQFFRNIEALTAEVQGAFWFCYKGGRHGVNASIAEFSVMGELSVYLPKDTTTDANSAIELAESVKDALLLPANYSSGEGKPKEISFEFHVDWMESGGIGKFAFGTPDGGGAMTFLGGC